MFEGPAEVSLVKALDNISTHFRINSTFVLICYCSFKEGIPEAPLRTVELIKRPLELREPATKLLYMASLGLYPRTGMPYAH